MLKSLKIMISIVLLCKKLRMESKVCKKFSVGCFLRKKVF